jgi:hypothetical protein
MTGKDPGVCLSRCARCALRVALGLQVAPKAGAASWPRGTGAVGQKKIAKHVVSGQRPLGHAAEVGSKFDECRRSKQMAPGGEA